MHSADKYQLYLQLTGKKQEQSQINNSNVKLFMNSQSKLHPTILAGKRNTNSDSYKKMHYSSEIFKENTTPIKAIERKVTMNEASQRKWEAALNSVRTILPSEERFQSPERNLSRSNVRYNVNAESVQKDSKRILKSCQQKDQDFSHRINLPISAMQVKDFKEDNYGLGKYKSHENTQKMKNYLDFQSQLSNVNNFTNQTDRMARKKNKSQMNNLTSYQICKTESKVSKKQSDMGKKLNQVSDPSTIQIFKPQNKLYQKSSQEIWDLQKQQVSRKNNTYHLDLFRSQLKLL